MFNPTQQQQWFLPTSHDPETKWSYPERAYNGIYADGEDSKNPQHCAYIGVNYRSWSSYLSLFLNPVYTTKLRVLWEYRIGYIRYISLDIRSGGTWINVYEGLKYPESWRLWQEFELGGTFLIDGIRVKFYNNSNIAQHIARVWSAEAWGSVGNGNGNGNGSGHGHIYREVSLNPNTSKDVLFAVKPTELGTYSISLGDLPGNFVVDPIQAAFQVSNLTINPAELNVGEEVTIEADIWNVGDAAGTCVISSDPDRNPDFLLQIGPGGWQPAAYVPEVYRPTDITQQAMSMMMAMMTIAIMVPIMKLAAK